MQSHLKPIAVCGVGLRLPGGIGSAEELWKAIQNKKDMRTMVPESRYCKEGFSDALGSKSAIKTQHGYFLDQDLASFDSSQFSLTEEEVKRADPQQRLLLEVVKECFENAGETNYRGRDIGCYVGTFGEDWLQSQSKEDQHSGGYIMSGQIDLMLANRVSYENDLRGPSIVVKTGCSASLVALHEACRAIQMNDCTGAVVAGTNLILGPSTTAAMTSAGILSPEGSCKTFSSDADGFARGEAVTAVYIHSLSGAIEKRLPIRAVIANTGVNCDGRSPSILQPSLEAQIALMRKVYNDVNLDPNRTAFVECHGTGTPTGDPIEAAAIGQIFGNEGVYIGSIKPNIGHSEGASGISSLLKGVLMLEKSMIAPNIKFLPPNPNIDFERCRLQVPDKVHPWPRDRDLRVSINSFGIGGSNAHVIMEHPYMYLCGQPNASNVQYRAPQLLLLSASTSLVLQTLSTCYSEYIRKHQDCLPKLAYALACRREHHQFRTFAVCSEQHELQIAPVVKSSGNAPGITMIFGGQGAQWAQMGHELLNDNPVFLQTIKAMDQVLKSLQYPPNWSIETELIKPSETSRVDQAEISQPLCTAIQVALFQVFQGSGVRPSATIGHSSGEIAAAYAIGAISMDEAIIIAYYRGLVTRDHVIKGGMAVIGLDSRTTRKFLKTGVVVACENSPSSTTISGDEDVLLSVLEEITHHHHDVLVRRLKVDVAYHSPHMQNLSAKYLQFLRDELPSKRIYRNNPTVPMFSSVWDQKITSAETLSPDYWVANLVSPVRFDMAVANSIREQGPNLLIEIGPHSALAGPLRQISSAMGVTCRYCATLSRYSHGTQNILSAFGTLYQYGIDIDWSTLISEEEMLTDLPPYPWDHSISYWYESRLAKTWRSRLFGHHELLGLRVLQSTDIDPVWRVVLDIEDVPWLADHKVKGDIVFPFAAYISMAGEALRQVCGIRHGYSIRCLSITKAMVLNKEKPLEIVTTLHSRPLNDVDLAKSVFGFTIASYTGVTWIQHCRGIVGPPKTIELSKFNDNPLHRQVAPNDWYSAMARLGLEYGTGFRRIDDLATSTKQMLASGGLSDGFRRQGHQFPLHPTVLDASFQVGLAALAKGLCRNFHGPQVPTYLEELEVLQSTTRINCTASCSTESGEISIEGVTIDGEPCLRLCGMRLTPLADDSLASDEDIYGAARLEWVPDYDFQTISSLLKIPSSDNREKQVVEELALLCIIESCETLKDLVPSMPHLLKYRDWLDLVAKQAFANQHPVLENTALLISRPAEERHRIIKQLCEEASSSLLTASFTQAVIRVHDNIQGLFTGAVDMLELLLQNNTLAQIYDSISFDYSDFICSLCDAVPSLRILEIGAGTGATTECILRALQRQTHLPRYAKYTFTDISAGFFPSARERFAGSPNMEFRVFDISQDPFQQGFEHSSYDLILASNVVHATPSLSQTLRNLQPLLVAHGQLVLTEFCTSFQAPNYIYGNFSGWWLGEADDREWEPYVNVDRWDKELRAAGFSGATSTVLDSAEPWQYCATIVTQKVAEEVNMTKIVSVIGENAQAFFNQSLIQGLKHEGLAPRHVALGDFSDLEGDVIVTLDLESRFFEDISEKNLKLFQEFCHVVGGKNVLWLMPPTQVNCVDPRGSQSLGMIRNARYELNLLISILEIDSSISNFAKIVTGVFHKVRSQEDVGSLGPDREFAVHENIVKIGRYRPFKLQENLRQKAVSLLVQAKLPHNAGSLNASICDQNSLPTDVPTGSDVSALKKSCRLFSQGNTGSFQPTSRCDIEGGYSNPESMQDSNNGGKAVALVPAMNQIIPVPQQGISTVLDPSATYMITGGLGGLGRAIAVWLAEKGACNLLFLSPSAGLKPNHHQLFTELESMGCTSVAVPGAVQNEADVRGAVQASKAPIKGVLHLAMQLRDASISDMTYDDWKAVMSPKVEGTWNLHRILGVSLEFFVMTSSLSAVIYQPGQSNYNAANTFMESFCQYRHSLGMPASVLNICPIEGVGFVAENSDARRKLKSQGHWFLDEQALLEFVELAILSSYPRERGNSSEDCKRSWENHSQIVMGLRSEVPLDDPSNRTTWRRDRRMGSYHNATVSRTLQAQSGSNKLKNFLERAENEPDLLNDMSARDYLAQEIGKKIFNFIMRPEEDMDISLTLSQLGLDSLMSIEVRRWWNQVFGIEISVLEIMNSGTVAELGGVAASGLIKKFAGAA